MKVLTAIFFLCVILQEADLAESVDAYLSESTRELYSFNASAISGIIIGAIAVAALTAVLITVQQLVVASRVRRLEMPDKCNLLGACHPFSILPEISTLPRYFRKVSIMPRVRLVATSSNLVSPNDQFAVAEAMSALLHDTRYSS